MVGLRQDLKYALRALSSRPWFSAIAVLTLAIGIGVNAVAFSAIDALLHKPMRFAGAREPGWIQTTGGRSPLQHSSPPDYLDLSRENRKFEAVIAEARLPLRAGTVVASAPISTVLGKPTEGARGPPAPRPLLPDAAPPSRSASPRTT